MPTVNVYSANAERLADMGELVPELCAHIASALTVDDRALGPGDVSVRLIPVLAQSTTVGEIELDVHCHEYGERVVRQDQLCREIAVFVDEALPTTGTQVWLILSQLGHSA